MAEGALGNLAADVAVSVTGIAGPGGGTPEKPVGLVWFGLATADGVTTASRNVFEGDRDAVRHAAALRALDLLAEGLDRL
jgi:nicotinamide-nucleotide amidase